MDRTSARESAMKLIYEWEMGGDGGEDTRLELLEIKPDENNADYMESLVSGVKERTEEIDALIGQYARGWSVDRISKVDLSIMRIAVLEIITGSVTPAVAVNEALDLAHRFSTDQSVSFINGILGNLARDRR